MEIKDRIRVLRKELHLSQDEFGQRIGVARNTIANYETGNRTPMEQTILSICREYNVDYVWLTTGTGNMFKDEDDGLIDQLNRILVGQNDFAKRIFKAFARMDESEWAALEKFIDSISEK